MLNFNCSGSDSEDLCLRHLKYKSKFSYTDSPATDEIWDTPGLVSSAPELDEDPKPR